MEKEVNMISLLDTSEKLKEEVYNVFKEEIETFGYEF